jgi:glycosyltransferase involved in cell wall biosynthesis
MISNELPESTNKVQDWPWTIQEKLVFSNSINWPKISIVTPSYNQGKYIEESIRSVLLQGYPNLEYIIIDGGSNDETLSIIKKYEPWITYWISEQDEGQSEAINKGIAKCTGDIFNWLNSDDWYVQNAFYEVATKFLADTELKFASGYENHIGLDGSISLYKGTYLQKTLEETIERCEIAQPSTFIKLALVKEVQGVSADMHFIMDGELWIKLLLLNGQNHFEKIGKQLVNFRFHDKSKTVNDLLLNNFSHERKCILSDLQQFIDVPEKIISYLNWQGIEPDKRRKLNRIWNFNDKIISSQKLKYFFIKKYINRQFIEGNKKEAAWGIKQLIKNGVFDFFLVKNNLKLLFKVNR